MLKVANINLLTPYQHLPFDAFPEFVATAGFGAVRGWRVFDVRSLEIDDRLADRCIGTFFGMANCS